MQSLNSNSVFYSPSIVPSDVNQLQSYINIELNAIKTAINLLAAGHLDMSYAAPTKPRDGDIRFADGTTWNPGSGKGFYGYYTSAWHFLG